MGKMLRKVLVACLVLVLVVTIGLCAWVGISARHVGTLFGQMSSSLDTTQQRIQAQDYSAAMASAREAAAYASEASDELAGMQWEIASKVPIIGVDADVMRSIGSIAGSLSNDAIVPVLDGWDTLVKDGIIVDNQIDVNAIGGKIDQFVTLAQTLKDANVAVDECSTRANAMPASHFEQLNVWTGQLKTTIASVDEVLDQLVGMANLVTGASSIISSLGAGAQGSAV